MLFAKNIKEKEREKEREEKEKRQKHTHTHTQNLVYIQKKSLYLVYVQITRRQSEIDHHVSVCTI